MGANVHLIVALVLSLLHKLPSDNEECKSDQIDVCREEIGGREWLDRGPSSKEHDDGEAGSACPRTVWLDKGRERKDGAWYTLSLHSLVEADPRKGNRRPCDLGAQSGDVCEPVERDFSAGRNGKESEREKSAVTPRAKTGTPFGRILPKIRGA